MNWLLAQETSDLNALLPLLKYGAYGLILACIYGLGIISKHVYGLWRNYKTDSNKDASDQIDLDIKRGEAKLALNIKEEEAVEAQLQRVISQQDNLITKQQARIDILQTTNNEMVGKIARLETVEKFLTQQLEDARKYGADKNEMCDALRRKYYTLKNGMKPDSDIVPPSGGTEMLPDHLQ